MSNRFIELLAGREVLLADGATGTNFFAAGLQTGDAPELWNLEEPAKVRNLHRAFVEAGSDIILTNTFGGTRNRLKLHKSQDRVAEINRAGAQLARAVADGAGRPVAVAGSMGPTGDLFEPLGPLSLEAATDAFAEQALALAEGGVDLLWIETISSVEEMTAAVAGAAKTGLPVLCTLSFDTNGRTMMGITPAQVAGLAQSLDPKPMGYGGNCGIGPAELLVALANMKEAAGANDILVAKSNCGVPEWIDGAIKYQGSPELMGEYARAAVDIGARIIGGCCGTSPEHVANMRAALDGYVAGPKPSIEDIVEKFGQVSQGGHAQHAHPHAETPTRSKGRRRGRPKTAPSS